MKKREQKQKKKKAKPDDKEQSARFTETAERIELVENHEELFESVVRKVMKKKLPLNLN